jgi:hypothetical protein
MELQSIRDTFGPRPLYFLAIGIDGPYSIRHHRRTGRSGDILANPFRPMDMPER